MPTFTANFAFGKPIPFSAIDENLWGGILNTSLDGIDSQFATRTALYNFADYQLQRPELLDYSEALQTVAFSATPTIDITLGNHAQTTLTGNITAVTISNPPATGRLGILRWYLTQDGTGSRTVAFPSSFKWSGTGSTAPPLSTAANATDIATACTRNGGTSWDARLEFNFTGL